MQSSDRGTNLKETVFLRPTEEQVGSPAAVQPQPPKAEAERKKPRGRAGRVFKRLGFVLLLIILLPFMLVFYAARGIVRAVRKKRWELEGKRDKRLVLSAVMSDVDIMEGYEFEEYLKALFFYDGYSVEVTPRSKDYGADLIMEKAGERIVVQAKRYNKGVGIKSVQEVLGAMKHYDATDACVVTNSFFTAEAELLAKENGVQLIDREELIEIQARVKEYLKLNTRESELVDKRDKDVESKYPFMI